MCSKLEPDFAGLQIGALQEVLKKLGLNRFDWIQEL